MFFRYKNKRNENLYSIKTMQKIKSSLIQLEQHYESASRLPVQKYLKEICRSTRFILKELTAQQDNAEKLAMFADYYLPETAAIAEQYLRIKKNHIEGEKSDQLVTEMEVFFPSAAAAYKQICEAGKTVVKRKIKAGNYH